MYNFLTKYEQTYSQLQKSWPKSNFITLSAIMEITPNKKLISISKPTFNLSPFTIPLHPFPGIKTSAWTSWRQSRMCGTSSTRMTSTTNRRRPAKIEVSRCMLFSGPCPAVRFCKVSFYFQLIYFWFRLSAGISLCLLYAPLSLFFILVFFHFFCLCFLLFPLFLFVLFLFGCFRHLHWTRVEGSLTARSVLASTVLLFRV